MRSRDVWTSVTTLTLCLSLVSIAHAKTRPAHQTPLSAGAVFHKQYRSAHYVSSAMDTFFVAEYSFDDPVTGAPDPQGWLPVDLTAQLGTYFHVDTFNVPSGGGTKAMWCGARADTSEPLCRYATLPGYGHHWYQNFTSISFPDSGDVTLSYVINYDVEPGYDFVYVQYKDTSDTWIDLISYTGNTQNVPGAHIIPSTALPGSVQVRFKFTSDESYSDEDGLWDTAAGACQIDNIVLSDTAGVIDSQDFEAEAVGALETLDGHWKASTAPGYGTFAALYPGNTMRQDGPCVFNKSQLWAFLNGSTAYGCGDLANEIVVPFTNERGQALDAAIESPVIDLTKDIDGNPIPADADRLLLMCDVYMDLPLDNLVFFRFGWQQYFGGVGACPEPWEYQGFLWHNQKATAVWKHFDNESFVLPVTAPAVRIQLRVVDEFPLPNGSGACHTPAPYIDNVKLVRIRSNGPSWRQLVWYASFALFNDAFPADGTSTGTVRMDMPADVSRSGHAPNAGDSVVVEVYDDTYGLGMDATGTDATRAAVYLYVRSSGGHVGPGVAGDGTLYVGDDGLWTRLLCDSARSSSGPRYNKYACDLNDNLFLPGDQVYFYFSATDGNGTTNYFTSRAGVVIGESEARANPDYVNCLPTGNSDILLVDFINSESSNLYFDTIFQQLGINPDRFRGRNTEASAVALSRIHLRSTGAQLAGMYKTILCYGGANGSFSEDDETVLPDFLSDQTHGVREANLYISGDNLVSSTNNSVFEAMIGTNVSQRDHGVYFPVNPTVTATPGSVFEHGGVPDVFYLDASARGVCRHLFDLLLLRPLANGEMSYGPPPSSTYFASVSRTHVNGNVTVKTMTDGFDFTAIRDDVSGYPYDMVDHIADVLQWFGYAVSPVDAGESPAQYVNSLSQNFPNPFNPTTTIRFRIKRSGHVKLEIYDVSGRLVEVLVDRDLAAKADAYEASWHGKGRFGNDVASGVYFYRLEAEGFVKTRKLVLLK